MNDTVGNVILYTLGISAGITLSRYLYVRAKNELITEKSNKVVVIVLKVAVIIIGFLLGFIGVVILYKILYLIVNGHE